MALRRRAFVRTTVTAALAAVIAVPARAVACDTPRVHSALHDIEARLREIEREAGSVGYVQWKVNHIRSAMKAVEDACR